MSEPRNYSDEQLAEAIAGAQSWRAVMRGLNLPESSPGVIRKARARAEQLDIDYRHFVGQRAWTALQLKNAVADSNNWNEVADRLGIAGTSAAETLEGHGTRLGISSKHFSAQSETPEVPSNGPSFAHLDRAGSLIAASWFALCGLDVSWPLEPSRYDLLVSGDGRIRKIQVKTTTVRVASTWKVYLSNTRRKRKAYRPGEIDEFFVVTADMEFYLVPFAAVGGLHAVHLRPYEHFRLSYPS